MLLINIKGKKNNKTYDKVKKVDPEIIKKKKIPFINNRESYEKQIKSFQNRIVKRIRDKTEEELENKKIDYFSIKKYVNKKLEKYGFEVYMKDTNGNNIQNKPIEGVKNLVDPDDKNNTIADHIYLGNTKVLFLEDKQKKEELEKAYNTINSILNNQLFNIDFSSNKISDDVKKKFRYKNNPLIFDNFYIINNLADKKGGDISSAYGKESKVKGATFLCHKYPYKDIYNIKSGKIKTGLGIKYPMYSLSKNPMYSLSKTHNSHFKYNFYIDVYKFLKFIDYIKIIDKNLGLNLLNEDEFNKTVNMFLHNMLLENKAFREKILNGPFSAKYIDIFNMINSKGKVDENNPNNIVNNVFLYLIQNGYTNKSTDSEDVKRTMPYHNKARENDNTKEILNNYVKSEGANNLLKRFNTVLIDEHYRAGRDIKGNYIYNENDKNDLNKIDGYLNSYNEIINLILNHIFNGKSEENINNALFSEKRFLISKLGNFKANGIYFNTNPATLTVDIEGWTSVIHETGHLVDLSTNTPSSYFSYSHQLNTNINNINQNLNNLIMYISLIKNFDEIISHIKERNKNNFNFKDYFDRQLWLLLNKSIKFGNFDTTNDCIDIKDMIKDLENRKGNNQGDDNAIDTTLNNFTDDISYSVKYRLYKLTLLYFNINENSEEILKLEPLVNLGNSKNNFKNYIISETEIFARLFEYYFKEKLKKDKSIKLDKETKQTIIKETEDKDNGGNDNNKKTIPNENLIEKMDNIGIKIIDNGNKYSVLKDYGKFITTHIIL